MHCSAEPNPIRLSFPRPLTRPSRAVVALCAVLLQIVSFPDGFVTSIFTSVEDWKAPFSSYRQLLAPGCDEELPLLWLRYLGDVGLRFSMALFFLVRLHPCDPPL